MQNIKVPKRDYTNLEVSGKDLWSKWHLKMSLEESWGMGNEDRTLIKCFMRF